MNALFFGRKMVVTKITSILTVFALLIQLAAPVIVYAIDEAPIVAEQTEVVAQEQPLEVSAEEKVQDEIVPEALPETTEVVEEKTDEPEALIPSLIEGSYDLNFICSTGWCDGQVFPHTMVLNAEAAGGAFTGTGAKNATDTTWTMIGTFTDPTITFTITYITGENIGYSITGTGTLENGVLSGTAEDSS